MNKFRDIREALLDKNKLGEDRTKADALVTYEIFKDRCLNKGYDRFQLGSLIELDVTDYEKVDYEAVLDRVDEIIDRD